MPCLRVLTCAYVCYVCLRDACERRDKMHATDSLEDLHCAEVKRNGVDSSPMKWTINWSGMCV